ncbi:MAG: DUF1294 domain-containing protein [Gammaproteobacteria bacterium]|nr:DUF1294 domain-containing protein [Gammaproteobacteria bacterium]
MGDATVHRGEPADFSRLRPGQVGGPSQALSIREQTLHALSLAGGWPGALIAQRWLRHSRRRRPSRRRSG